MTPIDLTITRGDTFEKPFRRASKPLIYKAISGITKSGPVVITATGHGVPDGWPVAVASVVGMREINGSSPPKSRDYHAATNLTANSISINDIDSSLFHTYTSGGYVIYRTPFDLTGYTGRMHIRETQASSTTLMELTSANGKILIDTALYTVTILIPATDTAAITWNYGEYDLELVSSGVTPTVKKLAYGSVYVVGEVTR